MKNAQEFCNKYRKLGRVWVEEDRWAAEIKRPFKEADKKLVDSLSDSAKILKAKGIASYMAESISNGFKVLSSKEILKSADPDLLQTIKNYLEENIV